MSMGTVGPRMVALVAGMAIGALGLTSVASAAPAPEFSPVLGSPFATGANPQTVTFSPSGGLVASANTSGGNLSVFSVSSAGVLTPVTGSPFTTGVNPFGVAFNPNGTLLANTNEGENTISVFSVSASGRSPPSRARRSRPAVSRTTSPSVRAERCSPTPTTHTTSYRCSPCHRPAP